MRSNLLLLILLPWLCGTARGAAPSEPGKESLLAVMDILNNTGEFSSFVDGMPDMLITELMESGDIKLVERTKVQTAMKALKLETSGLTQERNLELGKWLGVDGILFGTFNRVGDSYRLDVRAIDVQTGKIKVAASATGGRANVLDLIPDIGRQLRIKLAGPKRAGGGSGPVAVPSASSSVPAEIAVDSVPLVVEYKMIVSLFSESAIPHQRVRVYVDNVSLGEGPVVDGLDRYYTVFQGKVPVGNHTLTFVHGSVDKRGRWVRELGNQPQPYSFNIRKEDRPTIRYRMSAHEGWYAFKDFELDYHHIQGD